MMTLMKFRMHEVYALLGHLAPVIALCMPECEVPWQVPKSSSVSDKCGSGMQTFTGEAVNGAGNLYAAQD
jgi:hypothetical protein